MLFVVGQTKVWSALVKHWEACVSLCWQQSKTAQSDNRCSSRRVRAPGILRKAPEDISDYPVSYVAFSFDHFNTSLGSFRTKRMPNANSPQETDPQVLPLAVIKKKTPLLPSLNARVQLATCASMTKSFLAKAFPSPHTKLWRFQSSPTGVDDPTEDSEASDEQDDEAARGDICEIIVVAIQKITVSGCDASEEQDRVSTIGPGRLQHRSSMWGSAKWSQGQLQLPQRVVCSVHSGATTKVSGQPERGDNEFVFDEKFVFERRENDAQYHEVTIEVSSVAPGFGRKHRLGQVAVDLDAAFAAQSAGPIYQRNTLTTTDGSDSDIELHYVLHRLEVQNAKAAAASRVLTRSSTSLNDDDDMDACGQIFPDLWYLC